MLLECFCYKVSRRFANFCVCFLPSVLWNCGPLDGFWLILWQTTVLSGNFIVFLNLLFYFPLKIWIGFHFVVMDFTSMIFSSRYKTLFFFHDSLIFLKDIQY